MHPASLEGGYLGITHASYKPLFIMIILVPKLCQDVLPIMPKRCSIVIPGIQVVKFLHREKGRKMVKDIDIENQVSELCDSLMLKAGQGELRFVEETVVALIEYAGYELTRHAHTRAAASIFLAANEVHRAYELESRSTHQ